MDNSRFDDIIKSKLESHIDPIGPSGSEVSLLFDGLSGISSTAIAAVTKVLIATSGLLLITSLFFIYRTYILEETIISMQKNFVPLDQNPSQVLFQPDTLFWDSLEAITKRIISNNNVTQNTRIAPAAISKYQYANVSRPSFRLAPEDSQRFVNEVMEQLIATLESNPELFQELFAGARLPESPSSLDILSASETTTMVNYPKERKIAQGLKSDQLTSLLEKIAESASGYAVIENLINGYAAETKKEDQIGLLKNEVIQEPFTIDNLSNQQLLDVFTEFIKYDPEAATQASEKIGMDSVEIAPIKAYAIEKQKINENKDQKIISTPIKSLAEVRDEQYKENRKSWWLYAGPGIGSTPINEMGNATTYSFSLGTEFKPNDRIGISTGISYNHSNHEKHFDITSSSDQNIIDYYDFEKYTEEEQPEIKELKVNLNWIDIPLEARIYILPNNKINPFVSISLKARASISETHVFDTNQSGYISPNFESENKFTFPAYGFGSGIRYRIGTQFEGAIQIQKSLGGKKMGVLESQYNTLQGQALIFYRLD
jgi:hypothetical protein